MQSRGGWPVRLLYDWSTLPYFGFISLCPTFWYLSMHVPVLSFPVPQSTAFPGFSILQTALRHFEVKLIHKLHDSSRQPKAICVSTTGWTCSRSQ